MDTKKSEDLLATQRQLNEFRNELKADNASLRLEMKAGFEKVDARFSRTDARFDSIDGRFDKIDGRFNKINGRFNEIDERFNDMNAKFSDMDAKLSSMNSKFEKSLAHTHRMLALYEEQETRNKYVLDGYQSLHDLISKNKKEADFKFSELQKTLDQANGDN